MAWSKWIDLKRAPKFREMPFDMATPVAEPDYPYGTRVTFDTETISALGLEVNGVNRGDQLDLRAFGEVIAIHEDGSLTLQLQRMKVENEDAIDEPDDKEDD